MVDSETIIFCMNLDGIHFLNLVVIFGQKFPRLLKGHIIGNLNADDKLSGPFGLLFSSFLVILVEQWQTSIDHNHLPLPDRSHHSTRSRIVDLGNVGGLSYGAALRA